MFEECELHYGNGGVLRVVVPRFRPPADVLIYQLSVCFIPGDTHGHYREATHQRALDEAQERAATESVTVVLHTRDGQYVAAVSIVPSEAPPNVVFWGGRTFVLGKPGAHYYEGMVWPIMPDMQRLLEGRP